MHPEDIYRRLLEADAKKAPSFGRRFQNPVSDKPLNKILSDVIHFLKTTPGEHAAADIADALMSSPEAVRSTIAKATNPPIRKVTRKSKGRGPSTFYIYEAP